MINGNACFAYFNKNWGIPPGLCRIALAKISRAFLEIVAGVEQAIDFRAVPRPLVDLVKVALVPNEADCRSPRRTSRLFNYLAI